MKKILSFLMLFVLISNVNSQLDPFYFGTYINLEKTSSYTIYSMDEVTEACFIVEFEKYENQQTVFGASGFGHCESENSGMEIILDTDEKPLKVVFGIEDDGTKIMTFYEEDSSIIVFREMIEELTGLEEDYEEYYYSRVDGAELMLFANNEGLGFTIFGLLEGTCEMNEISGELTVTNEERTNFIYQDKEACKIEFQVSDGKIRILEEKCDKYRDSKCKNWNGEYFLNE